MSKNDDFIRKSLNEFQRILRTSAPAASASYSLIGSLIIFSLAGYFLDSYLLSFPLFLVLGLLLGIIVGFYGLYKFISKQMKHVRSLFYLEIVILMLGIFLFSEYKIEIFFGSIVPFFTYIIESYFYVNSKKNDPIQSTKILIFGFIFKMAFFAPFLLSIIYFYAFNTRIFVFIFLGSIILFHTIEAIIVGSFFNKKTKKV